MDFLPTKRITSRSKATAKADDGLGRGMEFAIVVLAFLGLGYLFDRWFDTKPLFMIVFVVLSLVGQFASMWYGYDARMKQHEAERLLNTTGTARPGKASPGKASPGRASASRASASKASPGGPTDKAHIS